MVLFVLIVVGIIIGAWSYIYDWGFDWTALCAGVLGGLCGALVGLIVLLIGAAIPGPVRSTEHHVEKLYAFEDDASIEGHFFLGSGRVDGEMKYYYIYETDDGGYKMDSIDTSNAVLYYIDDDNCRIEYDNFVYSNPVHYFFGIGPLETTYKIYIPKGSIINNYQVDLE